MSNIKSENQSFAESIVEFCSEKDTPDIAWLKSRAYDVLEKLDDNDGETVRQTKKDFVRNYIREHMYNYVSYISNPIHGPCYYNYHAKQFHECFPDQYYEDFKKEIIKEGLYSHEVITYKCPVTYNNCIEYNYDPDFFYDLTKGLDSKTYGAFKKKILNGSPVGQNAIHHNNKGVEHYNQGNYKKAIEEFRTALALYEKNKIRIPDVALTHRNLANSYEHLGLPKVEEHRAEALKIDQEYKKE